MADREKVIKGLGAILEETADMFYRSTIQDALALLKAREPVKPKAVNMYPHGQYACGNCGHISVGSKDFRANYCPKCGRAVKWE